MTDEEAMDVALAEARVAESNGDVPVGAVVVVDGEVIARAHNQKELRNDPTAHAEILALRSASESLGSWRLDRAHLVVTLEPCVMCAGALVASRLQRVAFGAFDPKAGAAGSLYNVCADPRLNHEIPVTGGVREDECGTMLREFFVSKRRPATEL